MNFRYDINGLRAIAVIAVVLFHFNPAWVPGGFVGVDVFFVISGFLMTSIIFKGLENDNFNLFKFYVARANRIIPALAVLCLALLVFGWFYLLPLDYRSLGKHVASSMGFLSNVIYWRESGYFDAASHTKWLLHTWSLSVEWQFYIIYPIVLVALKRFLSFENLKRLIVIGTVLGFGFSVVATMKWPNPAYYLFPTRAWEMMMGGVAFLYPWDLSGNKKKLTELTGLVFILLSYALVSSDVPWPGHFALIPVLGAYLMIAANQQSSVITNNKIFQSLGRWSYSIYLWHWPFVVIGYYFEIDNFVYAGLIFSIILGWISFKYIESYKFPSFHSWGNVLLIKPIWLIFILGGLSSVVYLTNGAFFHYSESIQRITTDTIKPDRWSTCHGSWDINKKQPNCFYGEGALGAIVIGDSHAEALIGMITSIYPNNKVLDWTISSCTTAKDIYNPNKGNSKDVCGDFIKKAIVKAQSDYKGIPIFIINRVATAFYGANELDSKGLVKFIKNKPKIPESMAENLLETACDFSKYNQVYTIRPIPELIKNVPNVLLKEKIKKIPMTTISVPLEQYMERQKLSYLTQDRMASECNVKIIDPIPYPRIQLRSATLSNIKQPMPFL